jgi:hypothetical protein
MGTSSMYLFGTESESRPPPNSGRSGIPRGATLTSPSATLNTLGFFGNQVPSGTSHGPLPFILTWTLLRWGALPWRETRKSAESTPRFARN